jgi:hypothetical protein
MNLKCHVIGIVLDLDGEAAHESSAKPRNPDFRRS